MKRIAILVIIALTLGQAYANHLCDLDRKHYMQAIKISDSAANDALAMGTVDYCDIENW